MKIRLLILFCLTSLLSCNHNDCQFKTLADFGNGKRPVFCIDKHVEGCTYLADVYFWADSTPIASKAYVSKHDESLYVQILKPESPSVKFFDFKATIGKTYQVLIPFKEIKHSKVDIQLEKIYKNLSGGNVYKYVIFNGFNYFDQWLDEVVFIDVNRGFIGSYFKDPEDDKYIIAPVGDILRNEIDYSNKEFRVLK